MLDENKAFEKALQFVLKHEGKYSSDPWGGRTIYGIAERYYPDTFKKVYELYNEFCGLEQKNDDTAKSIENKMIEEIKNFYKSYFWKNNNCHMLFYPLNMVFFDTAVNLGPYGAGKILQKALNMLGCDLKVDGIVGEKTMECLGKLIEFPKVRGILCFLFILLRVDYYINNSHREYWRGYWNRCFDLAKMLISEMMQRQYKEAAIAVDTSKLQADEIYALKILKCHKHRWIFEFVPLDEALQVETIEKIGGTD